MANDIARSAFVALDLYLRRSHYKGYEFDDLLGSLFAECLTLRNLFLQRLMVQFGKHCPINVRPLLRVPKLESTKARGFIANGYLNYYLYSHNEQWLAVAEQQLDWLLCRAVTTFPGMSWGNEFDFASRGGFFRKGLPTIVWTSLIAQTFDLAYSITGKRKYLDAVLHAGEFIVHGLEHHQDQHGICFAYAPGRLNLVHNSNLLGAATLLRCWRHSGNEIYRTLAMAAYRWTLESFNGDGSWYYGVGRTYQWIDNFHTAYILDCLLVGNELGGEAVVPFEAVQRTYGYWTRNFFLEDGTPKYYHNQIYPLDVQCASQAIETLSNVNRRFPDACRMASKVVLWAVRNLQKRNGAFRYQIRRYWQNNLESIHWGQATMLSALGQYLHVASGTNC